MAYNGKPSVACSKTITFRPLELEYYEEVEDDDEYDSVDAKWDEVMLPDISEEELDRQHRNEERSSEADE